MFDASELRRNTYEQYKKHEDSKENLTNFVKTIEKEVTAVKEFLSVTDSVVCRWMCRFFRHYHSRKLKKKESEIQGWREKLAKNKQSPVR